MANSSFAFCNSLEFSLFLNILNLGLVESANVQPMDMEGTLHCQCAQFYLENKIHEACSQPEEVYGVDQEDRDLIQNGWFLCPLLLEARSSLGRTLFSSDTVTLPHVQEVSVNSENTCLM